MHSANLMSETRHLIATYDFCTHYINMPHNKLKHIMRKLTSFVSMMVKTVLTKFGAT